MHRIAAILAVWILGGFAVPLCAGGDTGKISIIATLFPQYDFARQVAGGRANVRLLLPPGTEAHSFEPRPGDMMAIGAADVFLYTGAGMEPWAQNLLKGVDNKKLAVVDLSSGIKLRGIDEEHGHVGEDEGHDHDHGGSDPHFWLDLENAARMVDAIAQVLGQKDPANNAVYLDNAAAYKLKLGALDAKIRTELGRCRIKTIIHGGHNAFGYFAARYGLEFISPYAGFSGETEPSPRKIAELIDKMKDLGAAYVFHEELITPRVAETIARDGRARLLLLHAAHNISRRELDEGRTFLQIMEHDLEQLKTGLGYEADLGSK